MTRAVATPWRRSGDSTTTPAVEGRADPAAGRWAKLRFFYIIEVGGRLTDHRKLTCTRDAPQLLLTVRTTGGWNATGDHNRGPQLGTTAGWNATPDHKIACDFGCGSEF